MLVMVGALVLAGCGGDDNGVRVETVDRTGRADRPSKYRMRPGSRGFSRRLPTRLRLRKWRLTMLRLLS